MHSKKEPKHGNLTQPRYGTTLVSRISFDWLKTPHRNTCIISRLATASLDTLERGRLEFFHPKEHNYNLINNLLAFLVLLQIGKKGKITLLITVVDAPF